MTDGAFKNRSGGQEGEPEEGLWKLGTDAETHSAAAEEVSPGSGQGLGRMWNRSHRIQPHVQK